MVVWRATAEVSLSAGTSMGRAARRAGQSTPWNPAAAAVQAKRGHTAGWWREALMTSPALAAAMATWARTSTRRRSMASASVPPHSAPARSGTSWARPIIPTTRVRWVRE